MRGWGALRIPHQDHNVSYGPKVGYIAFSTCCRGCHSGGSEWGISCSRFRLAQKQAGTWHESRVLVRTRGQSHPQR